MGKFSNNPLVTGLVFRLALLFSFYPDIQRNLFVPFLSSVAESPNLDIWSHWLQLGGRADAFPYGIAMLAPLGIAQTLSNLIFPETQEIAGLSLGFVILFFDLTILRLLKSLEDKGNFSQWLYATSPLALVATYIHGQIDVIPTLYLILAFLHISKHNWRVAGIFLGACVSAKFSFIIVIPFILIFVFDNPRYKKGFKRAAVNFASTLTIFELPLLFLGSFRKMVLETPESNRIFELGISLGDGVTILIFPVIYLGLLYWLWRLGRTTLQVLITFSSISLFALALSAVDAIGWYSWSLALLCVWVGLKRRIFALLFIAFQLLLVVSIGERVSGATVRWGIPRNFSITSSLDPRFNELLYSVALTVGLIVVGSLIQTSIGRGDKFSLSKKPLVLAISGDSGVGKDTLSEAVARVFEDGTAAYILGDDYHRYERGDSMWAGITHLNPEANNLHALNDDVARAIDRLPVGVRHYDHAQGRFTKKRLIAPADLVVINGLHSLLLENVRVHADLKVHLEMDEHLRQSLKLARDTTSRGTTVATVLKAMHDRRFDSEQFIYPQRNLADLVLSFTSSSIHHSSIAEANQHTIDALRVTIKNPSIRFELIEILQSISNIYVEDVINSDGELQIYTEPQQLSSHDIEHLMEIMHPDVRQILAKDPEFMPGVTGLASIIVLSMLIRKRSK